MTIIEKTVKIPEEITGFTQQIDCVYKGLGRPVLYNTLSQISGCSAIILGDVGTGKTASIKLVPQLNGVIYKNFDSFTYAELSDFCKENLSHGEKSLTARKIFATIEELSVLSTYARDLLLQVVSKIITDHNYEHVTYWSPNLSIKNCELVTLIAAQPKTYSQLCAQFPQWDTMSRDRYTKFLVINPLRIDTIEYGDESSKPKLPENLKLPEEVTIEENKLDLTKVKELFAHQISKGRALLFVRGYLKAYTGFKGKSNVEQDDVNEFEFLFKPYLKSFNVLQKASLDLTLQVPSTTLKLLSSITEEGFRFVSKAELKTKLHCSDKNIEDGVKPLIENNLLIAKVDTEAVGQPVSYCMHDNLFRYFKEYDKSIMRIKGKK